MIPASPPPPPPHPIVHSQPIDTCTGCQNRAIVGRSPAAWSYCTLHITPAPAAPTTPPTPPPPPSPPTDSPGRSNANKRPPRRRRKTPASPRQIRQPDPRSHPPRHQLDRRRRPPRQPACHSRKPRQPHPGHHPGPIHRIRHKAKPRRRSPRKRPRRRKIQRPLNGRNHRPAIFRWPRPRQNPPRTSLHQRPLHHRRRIPRPRARRPPRPIRQPRKKPDRPDIRRLKSAAGLAPAPNRKTQKHQTTRAAARIFWSSGRTKARALRRGLWATDDAGGLRLLLVAIPSVSYKKRIDLLKITRDTVAATFAANFSRGLDKAISTAK